METFFEIWNARRIREKIRIKVLSNEEIKLDLAEVDLLPEEEKSSITAFTFGNKIIIVLWADIPVAILIESHAIANSNWWRRRRAFI